MDSYNPPITGQTIIQEQDNVNRTQQRLVNWKENMKDDHTFSAKIFYLINLSQVTWLKNQI